MITGDMLQLKKKVNNYINWLLNQVESANHVLQEMELDETESQYWFGYKQAMQRAYENAIQIEVLS